MHPLNLKLLVATTFPLLLRAAVYADDPGKDQPVKGEPPYICVDDSLLCFLDLVLGEEYGTEVYPDKTSGTLEILQRRRYTKFPSPDRVTASHGGGAAAVEGNGTTISTNTVTVTTTTDAVSQDTPVAFVSRPFVVAPGSFITSTIRAPATTTAFQSKSSTLTTPTTTPQPTPAYKLDDIENPRAKSHTEN